MTSLNSQTGVIPTSQDDTADNAARIDAAPMQDTPAAPGRKAGIIARWGAKFGFAAFMFFFIKGLLWLIVPAGLAAVAFLRG